MPVVAMKTEMTVEIKTVLINAKCSDCCVTTLLDANGKEVVEHEGYVPNFMPEEHFGDYIQLRIDLETGKILNWKAPTPEDLREWIDKNSEA